MPERTRGLVRTINTFLTPLTTRRVSTLSFIGSGRRSHGTRQCGVTNGLATRLHTFLRSMARLTTTTTASATFATFATFATSDGRYVAIITLFFVTTASSLKRPTYVAIASLAAATLTATLVASLAAAMLTATLVASLAAAMLTATLVAS
jgi:hypothetical protein